jgi:tetratricopeptide (TPR) repeat protein
MFFEHVHFSFRGNYQLGRLWAEHVAKLISPQTESSTQNWASQEECERDLGLTPWNRGFVIESVIRRMQGPPLSSQFNNSNRMAALQAEMNSLRTFQADTNNLMRSGQDLVNAIQRAPRDPFLYEGFANFLEAVGDRKQALEAYRKMVALLPHDYYGKLQTGRLLGELGQPAEGEPLLKAAAAQRPAIPDTWVELGNLCMMQQKFGDALKHYERAQKLRPNDASHICYVATALARLNRRTEAIAGFRRALQLRPDFWEAHFELAGVLAAENQVAESLREYAEAIRLNPRHATSRVNFGVMLVRQNRLDDAIAQFQTALQLDPQNTAARDYLQQVTVRREQRK